MKRIILILALVTTAASSFAQKPVKLSTYKNSYGPWNATEERYMFEDYTYTSITFSFYSEYISVNDQCHSVYRITDYLPTTNENGFKTTKCRCLDEQNRKCLFFLSSSKDRDVESFIQVYYDEFSFFYVIDK